MTVEPVSAFNRTYKPQNMDKGIKIDKTNMEKKDKDSTTENEVTSSGNTNQARCTLLVSDGGQKEARMSIM